jgi:hypothetical protein
MRHSGVIFVAGVLLILISSQVSVQTAADTTPAPPPINPKVNTCQLHKGSQSEESLLNNLTVIQGTQYYWNDTEHEYFFTMCGPSNISDTNVTDTGFIQRNIKSKQKFVLGRLDDVDLEGLIDDKVKFIRITYKNGDPYQNSCSKTARNAIVYIFCDKTEEFKMIEENNDREGSDTCGYIFKLSTPKMCPFLEVSTDHVTTVSPSSPPATTPTISTTASSTTSASNSSSNDTTAATSAQTTSVNPTKPSSMGVFPILLIVVFSILCVYFVVGTLFMRFARQARGWEQIPNWRLWQMLGNRSADCCNYICRCGQHRTEPNAYENIIDHASDDENLLNM